MLAVGQLGRTESIAALLCGDDVEAGKASRLQQSRVPALCEKFAAESGVVVIAPNVARMLPYAFTEKMITMPQLIDLHRPLPETLEELQASLRTSTTREDLRRIRKANFSSRVSTDPDVLRIFHDRYARTLIDKRFPADGVLETIEAALRRLKDGGEMVCLDRDGEWVAGIYNTVRDGEYVLGALGIKDGRDDIRRMHATSALLVRSFERGVELGLDTVSLGLSLPFLGKGPVWFKAKWGGALSLNPSRPRLQILMDLRHASVRQMLVNHPVLYCDGDELVLALWQEPGLKAIKNTVRDAERFPGIAHWYVLGDPDTLSEGREAMSTNPKIIPITVTAGAAGPLWLGEIVHRHLC